MGDPNASIPTPQPVHYRQMFRSHGHALHGSSLTFVSEAALKLGLARKLKVQRSLVAVKNTRGKIKEEHDPQRTDAEDRDRPRHPAPTASSLVCEPADKLPMAQRVFLALTVRRLPRDAAEWRTGDRRSPQLGDYCLNRAHRPQRPQGPRILVDPPMAHKHFLF